MLKSLLAASLILLTTPLIASEKDDVKSAARKLFDAQSYSWHASTESAGRGGNRFGAGPTDGKTEKDGYTVLSMTRGDNTTQAVLKNGKGAAKLPDSEWKSLDALAADDGGGQFNMARFAARMLQNYKTPAEEAQTLADGAKELTKSDDAYAGDLTEDAARILMSFRGRGGANAGNAPQIQNPKGTVKFWLKDGTLSKYQVHLQGSMSFNGNDVQIDRTTTTEIKDIGSTKVEVPEEAKSKLP